MPTIQTLETLESLKKQTQRESVKELLDLVGPDVVKQMEIVYNGVLIVPSTQKAKIRQFELLWGKDVAKKVIHHFAGEVVVIPGFHQSAISKRNKRIKELHAEGVSIGELADLYRLTDTQVKNIVFGYRHQGSHQLSLLPSPAP